MTDRIIIFYGSKRDYEAMVDSEISEEEVTIPFMDLIQHYKHRCTRDTNEIK